MILYYLFKKNYYETCILPLSNHCKKFLPKTKNVFKSRIVLFDAPYNLLNNKKLQKLRNEGNFIIALDWFGKFVPDINITIFPHKKVYANKKKYIGLKYIIIDDKFLDVNIKSNNLNYRNKKLLIVLGGGDILNQGRNIANYFSKLKLNVTLVEGPLVKNRTSSKSVIFF